MIPKYIQIRKVFTSPSYKGTTGRWEWEAVYRTGLVLSRSNRDHPNPKAAIRAARRAVEHANTCEWGTAGTKPIPIHMP